VEKLAARIERVRKDLLAIQQELTSGAAWERAGTAPPPPAAPTVDLASIQGLKSSVDEMRHFLWWLLQEISLASGTGADSLQQFRMNRATEMLCSLRTEMALSQSPDKPETRSFFDALQSFTTITVDRHMAESALSGGGNNAPDK
jgi:hypothetical protein